MEVKSKSWGLEDLYEKNSCFDIKKIIISAKQTRDLQQEPRRHLVLICMSGLAKIAYLTNGRSAERYLKPGEMMTISAGLGIAVSSLDAETILVEVSSVPVEEPIKKRYTNRD